MARKPSPEAKREKAPPEPEAPTSLERSLAAASHASIILFLFAVIPSVLIWAIKGRDSKFVGSQSSQACAAQIILDVITAVLILVYRALGSMLLVGWLFHVLLTIILFALWVGAFLYGLYGAAKLLRGEEFRYIIVSDLVGA